MARTEIAAVQVGRRAAEVRGLVPPVAGAGQPVDHALEVPLHRFGLAFELCSPPVREARARLRFELVRGHVLRLQRERVVEIGLEVGDALPRDAVEQIE